VAALAQLLYGHGANIPDADQHTDAHAGMFFQRIRFDLSQIHTDRTSLEGAIREVAERFAMRWRLAHGDDQRRPGLTRVESPRAVTTELQPSVSTTEPILFLVRAALDRLVSDLIADGRTAATLALTLGLDDVRNALQRLLMAA